MRIHPQRTKSDCTETGISNGFLEKSINCTFTPSKKRVNSSICSSEYQKRGAVSRSNLHHVCCILSFSSFPVPCLPKTNKSKSILFLCHNCKAIAVHHTKIWVDENSSNNGFNARCFSDKTVFAILSRTSII